MRRSLLLVPCYAALAMFLTWPAVLELGTGVPGAERTDLWNSLWSLWFVQDALAAGQLPLVTAWLDHPGGGALLVADLLGAALAAPLIPVVGLAAAYTLLVWFQLTLSGWAAHHLTTAVATAAGAPHGPWAGLVAGVAYASAPVLLSGVHNGTSESFAGGWAALAAWAGFRLVQTGRLRLVPLTALGLLGGALASWYSAVVAFLFVGAALLSRKPDRRAWMGLGLALVMGAGLVAPLAATVHAAATRPDNLVGIKHEREVRLVRRTVGPADPVGYLRGGDFRSPDFRQLSRYGEGFIHCHYLGWVVLLGAAAAGARRRKRTGWLWVAGGVGAVLSLGPVWVQGGAALILLGDRAVPFPYLLLEGLPGFGSLSLLWRLGQAPALALAVLAGLGWSIRGPRWAAAGAVAILLEGAWLSPLAGLPNTVDARIAPAIQALAGAPEGAVMNFPVVGGRRFLYEQTAHRKPVTGALNFPNNRASKKVWQTMLDQVEAEPAEFAEAVAKSAQRQKVRYVVVHIDSMARPDMHDAAVRALKGALDPIAGSEDPTSAQASDGIRVYQLW